MSSTGAKQLTIFWPLAGARRVLRIQPRGILISKTPRSLACAQVIEWQAEVETVH